MPENHVLFVRKTLGLQKEITDKDRTEINNWRKYAGRSLGASVALHMHQEANSVFERFSQKVRQELTQLEKDQLTVIIYYGIPPHMFLQAEAVVNSGKPIGTGLQINPETEKLIRALLPAGRKFSLETADSAQHYINLQGLGQSLRRSGSPKSFVNNVANTIILNLASRALKVMGLPEERMYSIAAVSCQESRERFRMLYDQPS